MIELNKIYNEPCLETMKRMDNESIDCVITSPPYFQLRDYGYDGQWGLESTYQEYLEHLWSMMDEVWRVLKPTGTVWVNLGDTYNGSKAGNTDNNKHVRGRVGVQVDKKVDNFLAQKSLFLLPHRFAIGCMSPEFRLMKDDNDIIEERTYKQWIIRNDIIWAKRNGMPESVRDRFSKKHEYMFFMVKQEKYYFDLDAVKEPSSTYQNDKRCSAIERARMLGYDSKIQYGGKSTKTSMFLASQPMKNPGSVSDFWDIPTKPSSDKHFAMYNDALITKPILAGCPEGGIIYDPFAGAGTTIACAMRAKRYGIGSEMSKEYCDIFERNISEIKNQVSLI